MPRFSFFANNKFSVFACYLYHLMIQIENSREDAIIYSYKNKITEAVASGEIPKGFPSQLQRSALRKLNFLSAAVCLEDLRVPPGNRLESLSGSRAGQYSIRINNQWRICFEWVKDGAANVEIVDYH